MSGFATIGRLERLRDYREAELFYNSVTPIRGRAEVIKPLGARRDADKYQIVKGGNDVFGHFYAAKLYDTYLVKFREDGEIVIATQGYNTALTMQFIAEVLGIGANRQRGSNVFRISGENYITKGKDELRLKHIGNGQFDIMNENKHFHYVINRSGANNVRKRTADFRGYLKGFISLRTQEVKKYGNAYEMVCVPRTEFAEIFGTRVEEDWSGKKISLLNSENFYYLTDKRNSYNKFMESSRALDALARSSDPQDYYLAAMMLCARASHETYVRLDTKTEESLRAMPHTIIETFDESQFKLYASEVLTMVEVGKGKVPNTKYDSWADPTPSDNEYSRDNDTLVIKV
jgi:hypothetical protein